ncbi:unnamed protein product [Pieris macdunnoughi]|uniref:Uncharacterized protein n=1 Tax=Pieris macdunnoughi TaxID=345717 RepID=A0A821RCH9_9NEOP|nr:unnamed protein product [Pieris macdunnoughi]
MLFMGDTGPGVTSCAQLSDNSVADRTRRITSKFHPHHHDGWNGSVRSELWNGIPVDSSEISIFLKESMLLPHRHGDVLKWAPMDFD